MCEYTHTRRGVRMERGGEGGKRKSNQFHVAEKHQHLKLFLEQRDERVCGRSGCGKETYPSVCANVHLQSIILAECFVTVRTLVWPLT